MLEDSQIEQQRIAGDITLVLENGSLEEKLSLLKAIEMISGKERKHELMNQFGVDDFLAS